MPFERTLDDAGPLPSRSSDNDGFRGWPSPAKIPNEKGFMGSDATPVGAGICGPPPAIGPLHEGASAQPVS